MKQDLIKDVVQGMLPYLNNAQCERLQEVLQYTLAKYEVTENKQQENNSEQNYVELFLSAKRIEGCSEKSLKYYKATIEMMIATVGKSVKHIETDDIRRYLTEYQEKKKSSKVTIDNIRRILSSFFSWLEDEDYILKSPVRRIHKVKTGTNIKETYSDEALELMRDNCTEPRDLAMIDMLASTGMRVGEMVLLNRNDIDFNERECIVFGKGNNDTDTQPVKLGDYLYIKGRIGWKGLKKSEYLPISNYRIINGESLTLSGIDWNKAGYISAERYEESPEIMLSIGDILLSKDGTIGKIGYVDKLDAPTSVASGIFVIRNTRQSEISTQFIYYLLKSKLFKAFIASRTEGSVIPHLYQKDFMEFEFQLPSPDDMKIFDDTTADMFSLVFSNLNENERLIHLRDSLLPKLMSGELDVSDTDI